MFPVETVVHPPTPALGCTLLSQLFRLHADTMAGWSGLWSETKDTLSTVPTLSAGAMGQKKRGAGQDSNVMVIVGGVVWCGAVQHERKAGKGCNSAESSGMGTIKRKEKVGVVTLDVAQGGIEMKI